MAGKWKSKDLKPGLWALNPESFPLQHMLPAFRDQPPPSCPPTTPAGFGLQGHLLARREKVGPRGSCRMPAPSLLGPPASYLERAESAGMQGGHSRRARPLGCQPGHPAFQPGLTPSDAGQIGCPVGIFPGHFPAGRGEDYRSQGLRSLPPACPSLGCSHIGSEFC